MGPCYNERAMTTIRGVRAVTFDLYNTLARFWPPVEQVQIEACSKLGIAVSAEGIAAGYLLADAHMARENAREPVRSRSRDERRDFFTEYERLVLQGAGVEADPTLARQVWLEVRQIPYDLALFDDTAPALQGLRALGLAVAVLSNVDQSSEALLGDLGLRPHVDFLLTSREVGADKPHPPIFLAALERAGVSAHQAVHVGDQVDTDVVGARSAGMHAVLLERPLLGRALRPQESAPRDGLPDGVPVVGSLEEVAGLLG